MARLRKATTQDLMRLDAIASHLKVKTRFPHPSFFADVTAASLASMAPVIKKMSPGNGEDIAVGLGNHLQLTFEEVHGPHDVIKLENHYLKGKKEIGFAQLRGEINQPGVDALLFERMHAKDDDPDRWVAVLNLQETEAKAYWNRFHELGHRIAEPPQGILPFRRHQFEASNPVEALIDNVASSLAFYPPIFRPLVARYSARQRLSLDVIDAIREEYAPTASLLSTINATVHYWPRPAAVLTARYRGRISAPNTDEALRIMPQGHNAGAVSADLTFWNNMRVPQDTPIHTAFITGDDQSGPENLGNWTTSQGKRLNPMQVYSSARMLRGCVYAVVSA
jgi:hypothetical protein